MCSSKFLVYQCCTEIQFNIMPLFSYDSHMAWVLMSESSVMHFHQ